MTTWNTYICYNVFARDGEFIFVAVGKEHFATWKTVSNKALEHIGLLWAVLASAVTRQIVKTNEWTKTQRE